MGNHLCFCPGRVIASNFPIDTILVACRATHSVQERRNVASLSWHGNEGLKEDGPMPVGKEVDTAGLIERGHLLRREFEAGFCKNRLTIVDRNETKLN